MEGPNQKTDNGQTDLEEIPNISNNNDQENTGHVYTEDREKKKTEERKADTALIAFKYKNQMIARYMSVSYTHLDVYKRQVVHCYITP